MRGGEMEVSTMTNNISSGDTTWEIWIHGTREAFLA